MTQFEAKIIEAAADHAKSFATDGNMRGHSFISGAYWAKRQLEPVLDQYASAVNSQREQIEAFQAEKLTLMADIDNLLKALKDLQAIIKTL